MIVVIIFTATKSTIVSVRTLRAIEKAQNICNIGGYSQSGGVALLGFLSSLTGVSLPQIRVQSTLRIRPVL